MEAARTLWVFVWSLSRFPSNGERLQIVELSRFRTGKPLRTFPGNAPEHFQNGRETDIRFENATIKIGVFSLIVKTL